ncbi:hypothetical protein, unlikely [Trypanosoma congolense IL3000]|uniref:Uncharacterized protein n=1 Tax=Trypanosoma congolense (strain IL3000) TaxID=1068625 RepID=F9W487_TRYCI|nr:hypothetical protein, unlikely [Trypanosoma congolense IL3000]
MVTVGHPAAPEHWPLLDNIRCMRGYGRGDDCSCRPPQSFICVEQSQLEEFRDPRDMHICRRSRGLMECAGALNEAIPRGIPIAAKKAMLMGMGAAPQKWTSEPTELDKIIQECVGKMRKRPTLIR